MYDLFTLHTWFSIAGGALGGISSYYDSVGEKMPIGERFLNFLIAIIAGVAFNSYVLSADLSPFAHLAIAVPVGAISRMTLKLTKSSAIELIKAKINNLLMGAAQKVIEKNADEQKRD